MSKPFYSNISLLSKVHTPSSASFSSGPSAIILISISLNMPRDNTFKRLFALTLASRLSIQIELLYSLAFAENTDAGQMADRGMFPDYENRFFSKTCLFTGWKSNQGSLSALFSRINHLSFSWENTELQIYLQRIIGHSESNEFCWNTGAGLCPFIQTGDYHRRSSWCLWFPNRLSIHNQK